jgi:hypothetical protein
MNKAWGRSAGAGETETFRGRWVAVRFRRGLGAAVVAFSLAVGGSAGSSAQGAALNDLLPHLHTTFSAAPSPIPVSSEGRIPVSLRLADSIWTDDGTHPPAATEVRFELDKDYRLDMADVPTCKPTSRVPRDQSPCDVGKVASGRMQVEVEFPEEQPVRVVGDATAYKTGPRSLTILTYLSAPVTAMMMFPVEVERGAPGIYDLRATAAIPKIAGGSGSLTYLGLRFRKGLFSAACPQERLQVGVRNAFVDGEVSDGAIVTTC